MKTAIYFIITCFISTGALLGATNAKNPFPAFAIAFGIWALFIWGYYQKNRQR
jgi:ABC-type transport system involved in multi-copper enzyme maturation permease subunit